MKSISDLRKLFNNAKLLKIHTKENDRSTRATYFLQKSLTENKSQENPERYKHISEERKMFQKGNHMKKYEEVESNNPHQLSTVASTKKLKTSRFQKKNRKGHLSPDKSYNSNAIRARNNQKSSLKSTRSKKRSLSRAPKAKDFVVGSTVKSSRSPKNELKSSNNKKLHQKSQANSKQPKLENIKISLANCKYDIIKRVACDK